MNLERHIKKLDCKSNSGKINNIDFIYLINLEQRPDKYQKSLEQLRAFGIVPYRVPAIYGWGLSSQALNELSLHGGFHPSLSLGAVGCALSHLSILEDAVRSGSRTIWVLEDDLIIKQSPALLSTFIDELDQTTGGDWDVLYTDLPHTQVDVRQFWRPNCSLDLDKASLCQPIGRHFFRIGWRCQMHSVIFRRSGIEKILQFEKEQGLFLPYDVDPLFIPGLKLFMLRHEIVSAEYNPITSDTERKHF